MSPARVIDLTPDEAIAARAYLAARAERKPNGCLEWTRAINGPEGKGRPIAWVGGHRFVASRLAWHLHMGAVPVELYLCHRCDNPRCIDVEHLFLGTAADNSHDRDAKGRQRCPSGELHPQASTTDAQVREAMALLQSGATVSSVSHSVGVSRTSVRRWRNGATRRAAA